MKDTPFPTFCRILEALRVKWQNSTPLFTSTPERRNGNIYLCKYFISSSGDRTHNQSVLQSHIVPLCHDRRHVVDCSLYLFLIYLNILFFFCYKKKLGDKTFYSLLSLAKLFKHVQSENKMFI